MSMSHISIVYFLPCHMLIKTKAYVTCHYFLNPMSHVNKTHVALSSLINGHVAFSFFYMTGLGSKCLFLLVISSLQGFTTALAMCCIPYTHKGLITTVYFKWFTYEAFWSRYYKIVNKIRCLTFCCKPLRAI